MSAMSVKASVTVGPLLGPAIHVHSGKFGVGSRHGVELTLPRECVFLATMNIVIALILAWGFSWAEDQILKRHLRASLRAHAGGFKDATYAESQFNSQKSDYSWVKLGSGLSLITLSYPDQFTFSWAGLSFAAGAFLCLSYIVTEIGVYNHVAKALKAPPKTTRDCASSD